MLVGKSCSTYVQLSVSCSGTNGGSSGKHDQGGGVGRGRGASQKTNTVANSYSPVWHETFNFIIVNAHDEELHVEVNFYCNF